MIEVTVVFVGIAIAAGLDTLLTRMRKKREALEEEKESCLWIAHYQNFDKKTFHIVKDNKVEMVDGNTFQITGVSRSEEAFVKETRERLLGTHPDWSLVQVQVLRREEHEWAS